MLYSSLMLETSNKETQRSKSNYREPKRSTLCSTSSIHSSLHHKYQDTIQFHLTFYMELNLSSKHLSFLSFQTVHRIHAGIILHHFFQFLLPPLLIQQLSKSAVCSGIPSKTSLSFLCFPFFVETISLCWMRASIFVPILSSSCISRNDSFLSLKLLPTVQQQ